jgi:hypothetical protein
MVRRLLALLVFLAWAPLALAQDEAEDERRVALVIGNGAYQALTVLANPPNDASDVANALEDLNFEVIRGNDLTLTGMREAIARFTEAAAEADVSLFYYAGHGLQLNQQNYIVPVDAELSSAESVVESTVTLTTLLESLEGRGGIHLIFLDACRNNPLPPDSAAPREAGLARVGNAAGFLFAFATQPDNVAYDGAGRNSPFAQALLSHLASPGLDVSSMMISVRQDVIATTGGYQVPWENSSLTRQFFFAPGDRTYASPEVMLWQLAGRERDPQLMQVYLQRYPDGAYVSDVRALMAELQPEGETMSDAGPASADSDEEVGGLLWSLARTGRTRSLAELYLARYPDGPHAADAETLLASLPVPDDPSAPAAVLCERLATHPRDATANVAGVELPDLQANAAAAIEACRNAVAANPDVPHFEALLARSLAASGAMADAVALYREAAEAGDLRALVSVGLMTEAGDNGIARDPQAAAALYERAAEGGSPDGAINLAVMLIEGTTIPSDVPRAVELLKGAAAQGSPIATYNLGVLADRGVTGTPADALASFQRAIELGDARGYVAAAILLDEGRGVERDSEAAADLLLRGVASDRGEAFNQLTAQSADWSPDTIRAIQSRLQQAGYYNGALDAESGPLLAAALRQWRLLGPPSRS